MTCDARIARDCCECNRPYCPLNDYDDEPLTVDDGDGWDD